MLTALWGFCSTSWAEIKAYSPVFPSGGANQGLIELPCLGDGATVEVARRDKVRLGRHLRCQFPPTRVAGLQSKKDLNNKNQRLPCSYRLGQQHKLHYPSEVSSPVVDYPDWHACICPVGKTDGPGPPILGLAIAPRVSGFTNRLH